MPALRVTFDAATKRAQRALTPEGIKETGLLMLRDIAVLLSRKLPENTRTKMKVGSTGAFRAGWLVQPEGDNGIRIRNLSRVSRYIELGWRRTKPIVPVRAKVLSWFSSGRGPLSAFRAGKGAGGPRVFAMIVKKGASFSGYHVVAKTFQAEVKTMLKICTDHMRNALARGA